MIVFLQGADVQIPNKTVALSTSAPSIVKSVLKSSSSVVNCKGPGPRKNTLCQLSTSSDMKFFDAPVDKAVLHVNMSGGLKKLPEKITETNNSNISIEVYAIVSRGGSVVNSGYSIDIHFGFIFSVIFLL